MFKETVSWKSKKFYNIKCYFRPKQWTANWFYIFSIFRHFAMIFQIDFPNLNWDSVLYLEGKSTEVFLSGLLIRQVMTTCKNDWRKYAAARQTGNLRTNWIQDEFNNFQSKDKSEKMCEKWKVLSANGIKM